LQKWLDHVGDVDVGKMSISHLAWVRD
jgi:hypothetical protein